MKQLIEKLMNAISTHSRGMMKTRAPRGTRGTRVTNMTNRQNVTIQLDKDLIRKARIVAAKRGTSVSGLLASELKRLVGDDDAYETARRSALEFLERGFHFGGERVSRDELHER
jgi:hypothetical protein